MLHFMFRLTTATYLNNLNMIMGGLVCSLASLRHKARRLLIHVYCWATLRWHRDCHFRCSWERLSFRQTTCFFCNFKIKMMHTGKISKITYLRHWFRSGCLLMQNFWRNWESLKLTSKDTFPVNLTFSRYSVGIMSEYYGNNNFF